MPTLVDDSILVRRGNPDGGPTRADTWRLTVTLDGRNMGVWDQKTGGEIDSDVAQYKPGGMAPQVSLGGTKQTNNVTLERLYRLQRDHNVIQKWINAVGKGRVTVAQQPMDTDGNAFGTPVVYSGTLKQVKLPDVDSTSTAAAKVSIEVVVDGQPHVG